MQWCVLPSRKVPRSGPDPRALDWCSPPCLLAARAEKRPPQIGHLRHLAHLRALSHFSIVLSPAWLQDNQGYSALAFSTSFNHIGVLDVLLRAKADPNVQDEFGITPLIHSAARGYADAVEMLLKAGAKPGLMDMEGKNALDYAESADFDDVVAMLAACDDGPSICSTFRDGTEASQALSQRGGGMGATMSGGEGITPSPRASFRGQASARMTPRVPLAGEVSSRLTPRTPFSNGGAGGSGVVTPQQQRPAYRGLAGNGRNYEISPQQMGSLERDKMLYLAKKLVHLSILLEQVSKHTEPLLVTSLFTVPFYPLCPSPSVLASMLSLLRIR